MLLSFLYLLFSFSFSFFFFLFFSFFFLFFLLFSFFLFCFHAKSPQTSAGHELENPKKFIPIFFFFFFSFFTNQKFIHKSQKIHPKWQMQLTNQKFIRQSQKIHAKFPRSSADPCHELEVYTKITENTPTYWDFKYDRSKSPTSPNF